MWMRSSLSSFFTFCLVIATAGVGHAQDSATEAPLGEREAAARAEFRAGADAFSAGRYEEALEFWERSYELAEKPELLYNMGTALDRLRRNREAIDAFTAYLSATTDASNRTEIEARIERLRQAEEESHEAPSTDRLRDGIHHRPD